jgi:HSP20 family molecular chaperone IbpA
MPRPFGQFYGPGPLVPVWDIVDSLTRDLETRPFSSQSITTDKGLSVSPFIYKSSQTSDGKSESLVSPLVDVYDTPEGYVIVGSVPGADASTIGVDYDAQTHELSISGVVDHSLPDVDDDFRRKHLKVAERPVGRFERKIHFPVEPKVDDANIKANFSNGMLRIVLPKVKQSVAEKRKIAVAVDDSEPARVKGKI